MDQAISTQANPLAEPIPFILNCLQIREESRNLEKLLKDSVPPSRWI